MTENNFEKYIEFAESLVLELTEIESGVSEYMIEEYQDSKTFYLMWKISIKIASICRRVHKRGIFL